MHIQDFCSPAVNAPHPRHLHGAVRAVRPVQHYCQPGGVQRPHGERGIFIVEDKAIKIFIRTNKHNNENLK